MSAKIATGGGTSVVVASQMVGDHGVLAQLECQGELLTFDTNLENVFGSQSVIGPTQRVMVDPLPSDKVASGVIAANKPIFGVNCEGYATALMTIGGTWTGTITFEGWGGGAGDCFSIYGSSVAANTVTSTTTASGAFRFSCAGLKRILARFSTATTGNPTVSISLSQNPAMHGSITVAAGTTAVTGTVATSNANLATVFGAVSLLQPVYGIEKTTTALTGADRLKVEATGRNIGDPLLRNYDGTFQHKMQSPGIEKLLESIYRQLLDTNALLLLLCSSAGCNLEGFSPVGEVGLK